jgi:hypothetical protein
LRRGDRATCLYHDAGVIINRLEQRPDFLAALISFLNYCV